LDQLQLSQKKVTAMGVNHEQLLLEETASREHVLLSTISNLETELRSTRQMLERVTDEKVNVVRFCKVPCKSKKLHQCILVMGK